MNQSLIDLLFLVTALAFNLLIAGIYIATRHENPRWVRGLGMTFIALAVPFGIVLINAIQTGQEAWKIFFLVLTLVYIGVELLFDFILKIDFRRKPILHIPYLVHFYVVLFGLIGMSFDLDLTWGWTVSVSFWILLASLMYMISGRRSDVQRSYDSPRKNTWIGQERIVSDK